MIQLSDEAFESVISSVIEDVPIDLKEIQFIDPYGMVGLLEAGAFLKSRGIKQILRLPQSKEVLRYLERMDFFRYAGQYFRLEPPGLAISGKYRRSSYSDVLLEITPIEKSDDIHFFVGKVKIRAHAILAKPLLCDEKAIHSLFYIGSFGGMPEYS